MLNVQSNTFVQPVGAACDPMAGASAVAWWRAYTAVWLRDGKPAKISGPGRGATGQEEKTTFVLHGPGLSVGVRQTVSN